MRRPIVLIGMPGSGKSEVGPIVAEGLKCAFIDLDVEITRSAGSTIAEMFAASGEAGFRAEEGAALQRALQEASDMVIATGGGIVVADENRALMHESSTVVWLDATRDVLADRLAADATVRPLIASPEDLDRLMQERRPLYEGIADVVVDASATPHDVASAVLRAVEVEV